MKQLLKLLFALIALGSFILLSTGCKKSKPSSQLSVGTGSYTFNGTMVATNDTLGPDVFSGGKDLTMWPTSSNNLVFVYNMPSQSSGSVSLSDGSQVSGITPYILGKYGQINFASVNGSGSVTKTGTNSFTFTCTVADQINIANTYSLSGTGTY